MFSKNVLKSTWPIPYHTYNIITGYIGEIRMIRELLYYGFYHNSRCRVTCNVRKQFGGLRNEVMNWYIGNTLR